MYALDGWNGNAIIGSSSDKLSSIVSRVSEIQPRGTEDKASHADAPGRGGALSAGQVHRVQRTQNPRENAIDSLG